MSAGVEELTMEEAARWLANENARGEDAVRRIYWFPHERMIRLVMLDEYAFREDDDPEIHPFYFGPTAEFPFQSGIALVHPEDERRKTLPPSWETDWDEGVLVYEQSATERV